METPSRVASAAAGIGAAAFALAAGAPAATSLGLVGPRAFFAFLLGGALGVAALCVGIAALWWTRPSAHRHGRGRAVLGIALGGLVVAAVMAAAGGARDLPRINDITTDVEDPPAFVHAPSLTGAAMDYDAARFAEPTRRAYADLATLRLPQSPAAAFARVESAARDLGWEIAHRDPEAGTLEATDTSRIFRFVDDVVVRVRPAGEGCEVDVRSRSRLGRGDMGANAARIRALRTALGS